jgi:hypothetical protein
VIRGGSILLKRAIAIFAVGYGLPTSIALAQYCHQSGMPYPAPPQNGCEGLEDCIPCSQIYNQTDTSQGPASPGDPTDVTGGLGLTGTQRDNTAKLPVQPQVPAPGPSQPPTMNPGVTQEEANICVQAYNQAKTDCTGYGNYGMAAAGLQTVVGSLSAANFSASGMCQAGSQQAYAALAGSGMVNGSCENSASDCLTQCEGVSTGYVLMCNNLAQNATQNLAVAGNATSQAIVNARSCLAYLQSQNAMPTAAPYGVADPCVGAQASQNVQCPAAYCPAHPGSNLQECQALAGTGLTGTTNSACLNPATAQNTPSCGAIYCTYHPTDTANCSATGGATGGGAGMAAAGPPTGALGPPPAFPGDIPNNGGFMGASPMQQNPYNNGYPPPYGGGGDMGGGSGIPGGGAPGGPPANTGAQAVQANAGLKDPGGSTAGVGGAGGFRFASVPTNEGGGGGSWGGANEEGVTQPDFKMDLSKFLPGAALDPTKRLPAGSSMQAIGITGANELSNFEKISRMMSKKRPFLKSAEGR